MVKIIWTNRSLADLQEIGDYISRDSVQYARLTLERIILYSGNLVEALGFENAGHDVFQQYKPLLMAFELFQPPASANDAAGSVTYMYHGCWLQNNPLDFDITQDDLKMIQSINIIAAGVKRS